METSSCITPIGNSRDLISFAFRDPDFGEEKSGLAKLRLGTNEPPHDKTNKMTFAPSLIRVFAVLMKKH